MCPTFAKRTQAAMQTPTEHCCPLNCYLKAIDCVKKVHIDWKHYSATAMESTTLAWQRD